jgi:hypothetical protein
MRVVQLGAEFLDRCLSMDKLAFRIVAGTCMGIFESSGFRWHLPLFAPPPVLGVEVIRYCVKPVF